MYLGDRFSNQPLQDVLRYCGLDISQVRVGVYGTLRKDGTAHRLMNGLAYDYNLFIGSGTAMYDTGAFPFVVTGQRLPRSDYIIRGALVELYSLPEGKDQAEEILTRLDGYEGVPHLYNRSYYLLTGRHRDAEGNLRPSGCLVVYYTWAREGPVEDYDLIPGGDWILYKRGEDISIKEYEKMMEERERAVEQVGGVPEPRLRRTAWLRNNPAAAELGQPDTDDHDYEDEYDEEDFE